MTTKPRVCLIGAGASGITALCQWSHLAAEGLDVPDVVCYEKQKSVGGQWNFTWRIGSDENGEPVHSSVYRHMLTNTQKEAMESPDYTFDEHFGRATPSYLNSTMIKDYLHGRLVSKPGNLMQYIQFNTAVKRVSYDEGTADFTVTVRNYDTDTMTTSTFSHVIVATGIRCTPRYPEYPGFSSFPGRILHAHDFKDGKQFRGQRVLIVGSNYGAEDLALHLHKYGAEQVIISHRTKPTGLKFPATVAERPCVDRVDKSTVHFIDGTSAKVDTIILATGYLYDFPFLDDDLRMDPSTPPALYPELYKLTLWTNGGNNKLFYSSEWDNIYSFLIYNPQAVWIWHVILGIITLPDKEAMLADIASWLVKAKQVEPITHQNQIVTFQSEFMDDFCKETGYERVNLKTDPVMKAAMDVRADNLPSYKDEVYVSPQSGGDALKAPKPWLEDVDDEFEQHYNTFIKYKEVSC